jgi:hypothetical protein
MPPLRDRVMSVTHKGTARRKAYLDRVMIFEALRSRLLKVGKVPDCECKLAMIDRKIRHLKRRANMPSCRIHRVPHILREWINLGYNCCSEGFLDVVRDLVEKDQC